jgi:diguanylate cyclase (GGDEF)-like protein
VNEPDAKILDLSESLLHREAEIELLQRTFSEIGSELNLERVFLIVAERARELIKSETVLIPIIDYDSGSYTYRAASGKGAGEIVGETLSLDVGVCGWVLRHKKPWWRGVLDDLSLEERNRLEKKAGTYILVPMQGKKHFLGGIAGINKTGASEFSRRDFNLLTMFASIVAIAVENAMAVKTIEQSQQLTEDYRRRLELVNRQLVESSKELEFLTLYDPLTSLPNRSLFHDRLRQTLSLAEMSNYGVGLLLIDLDRFKNINDAMGHDIGDQLLKAFAQHISAQLQPNETLARLGSDEFVIVLPEHDYDATMARADGFYRSLAPQFVIAGKSIAVAASIGVAVYPGHSDDARQLLSHADTAMQVAKQSRQGVSSYNPGDDRSALGRLTMESDLRVALESNAFELYYQPKLDMRSREIVAAEALGRWQSGRRGFIPPGLFIRALEQYGLIDRYTNWAIEQVLQQAQVWESQGRSLKVAVNISTQTLMNPEFMRQLDRIIGDQTRGRHLTFEITENLFLSEYDRLVDVLEHICKLGVTLSIDDFGTGYSSLSRLRNIPVKELKIDKSFIIDMTLQRDDEVIVRSTIDMAHNLDLSVVAEGIETEETYNRLVELGCDMAQGFLISKPLPLEQFNEFITGVGYKSG